jgi:hypothetical protein
MRIKTVTNMIAALDDEREPFARGCRAGRLCALRDLAIIFEIVLAIATSSIPSLVATSLSTMTPFGLTFLAESFDAFGGVVGFH